MKKVTLISYGIKNRPPMDVDVDINCRVLKNPHNVPELRDLTGLDLPVKEFVFKDPHFGVLKNTAVWAVTQHGEDRVAFCCFGGRHRSVAVAEIVADYLRDEGYLVELQHLSLDADRMEATGVRQAAGN
jgi:UPF0042 nucleotide-binding protein